MNNNPASLEGGRWSYSINPALCLGGKVKEPSIQNGGRPAGLSAKSWQDLRTAALVRRHNTRKILGLLVLVSAAIVGFAFYVVWAGLLGLNDQVGTYITLTIIYGSFIVLPEALIGVWMMSSIRRNMEAYKPVLRSEGFEMEFRVQGTTFFVVGIMTITKSQYDPQQQTTGEMGVVVLENEIC